MRKKKNSEKNSYKCSIRFKTHVKLQGWRNWWQWRFKFICCAGEINAVGSARTATCLSEQNQKQGSTTSDWSLPLHLFSYWFYAFLPKHLDPSCLSIVRPTICPSACPFALTTEPIWTKFGWMVPYDHATVLLQILASCWLYILPALSFRARRFDSCPCLSIFFSLNTPPFLRVRP